MKPLGTILLTAALAWPTAAGAAWPPTPLTHVTLCNTSASSKDVRAIGDGQGGAIAVWWENRDTVDLVYARRVTAAGVPSWSANGNRVTGLATANQSFPEVTSDGANGAIVAWMDDRSGNDFSIWAQRLDANGNRLWAADGVEVGVATGDQGPLAIVADGAGGAVVVWADARNGLDLELYAQRLASNGSRAWGAGGKRVCTAAGDQTRPRAVRGSTGTFGVAWEDLRSGITRTFIQALSSTGDSVWAGARAATSAGSTSPSIVADAAGGFYVFWNEFPATCRGQRFNAAGAPQWPAGGHPSFVGDVRFATAAIADGSGNALLLAARFVASSSDRVDLQKIAPAGMRLWGDDGRRTCDDPNLKDPIGLVTDAAGGAVCTWLDYRYGVLPGIFAQRVDGSGNTLWLAGGVPVDKTESEIRGAVLAPGVAGGAVAVWTPYFKQSIEDVYAHGIAANGSLGSAVNADAGAPDMARLQVPRPSPLLSGVATIRFDLPRAGFVTLAVVDGRGRTVRRLRSQVLEEGAHTETWDGADAQGQRTAPGVYFVELTFEGERSSRKLVRM